MEEYRSSLVEWLSVPSEDGVSLKNSKAIIEKLSDAEVATFYLAVLRHRVVRGESA